MEIENGMSADFGIYIQTWPGDFHLSRALIGSIRHWHPDLPITLIPGNGFDRNDHPFDVPVMEIPEGFLGTIEYSDRCFWSWHGPYEKFMFLDADMICCRSLAKGFERIQQSAADEIFVHIFFEPELWQAGMTDPAHPRHEEFVDWVRMGLGVEKNIRAFDPDWDYTANCPVPGGVWGGTRGGIPIDAIEDLNRRERAFYENVLNRPFEWNKGMVFYMDQARMTYLIDQVGLRRQNSVPDLHDQWAGEGIRFSMEDFLANRAEFAFIHWAGVPRPSPSFLCRGAKYRWFAKRWDDGVVSREWLVLDEIPAYSVWQHFYELSGGKMTLSSRLKHTRSNLQGLKKQTARHRP